MPEGPIVGLNVLGKWVFDLATALLSIYLAINIFKVAKNLLQTLGIIGGGSGKEVAADTPLKKQFTPALRGLVAIILMIITVKAPGVLIKDADSIDSIFTVGWNVLKGIFGGFGGSGSTEEGSILSVFAFALIATKSIDPFRADWRRTTENFWMRVKSLINRIKVETLSKIPGG